jgi:hypothetical protein
VILFKYLTWTTRLTSTVNDKGIILKKEELANILNISRNTLNNWKKEKPELYKIIEGHFEEDKIIPDINNSEYLKQEMIKAIDTLPKNKIKKFYHLMMAELAEMGH